MGGCSRFAAREKVYAAIGGGSEFLGGIGLALRLFTPLAATAVIGVMINAMATVTGAHGLWESQGGVGLQRVHRCRRARPRGHRPGKAGLGQPFPWGRGGWAEAAVALFLGGMGAAIALIFQP